jgi:uncharacterized membrane protein YjjP (DUF1212 family)
MSTDVYKDTIEFTGRLGAALAQYGAPAHRVEDVLNLLTQDLDIDGVYSATPSILLMEFRNPEGSHVRLERVHSNEIDLGRLQRLDQLFNQVADKSISPREGLVVLEHIITAPPRFGPWITTLAFAATSASATPLFGGAPSDMLLGLLAGASVGLVAQFAPPRLLVPIGGFCAAWLVSLCAPLMATANLNAAILGGIIVLVPGFTLTLGVSELVTHNITAGVSRLGAALVTALMLSFGVIFGHAAASAMVGATPLPISTPSPSWLLWSMVPVAVVTINILFNAPVRQWGWILLTSSLSYGALEATALFMRPDLAVFIGALTLGCASNLYARFKNMPAAIIRMPGLLFLVPGSLSFLSIRAVMEGHAEQASASGGQLILVAISLVMGMVVAGTLIPPRKAL